MNPRKRESKFAFACSTWNNALLGVAAAPARLPLIGLLVSVRREGRGKLSNTIKTIAINTGGTHPALMRLFMVLSMQREDWVGRFSAFAKATTDCWSLTVTRTADWWNSIAPSRGRTA